MAKVQNAVSHIFYIQRLQTFEGGYKQKEQNTVSDICKTLKVVTNERQLCPLAISTAPTRIH